MSHLTITLLSDLGRRDASVAVMKAILMRYAPGASLVDISHDVARSDLQQAAYLLLCAYKHFPKGAIHVLPVDVFAGSAPRMLLMEKEDYFFIVPDNGILPLAFGGEMGKTRECMAFSKPYLFSEWTNNAGRAIEALGRGDHHSAFPVCKTETVPRIIRPNPMPYGVDCNILYIDRYENVVLNITSAQFDELAGGRPFRIKIMRMPDVTSISSNYNDVPEGSPLCRFNEAGFLEIALNGERAASLLGMGAGSGAYLRYQSVKIFF